MGKQNDAFTAYLGRAEVLADLYNGCLYQGEEVVKAGNLCEATAVLSTRIVRAREKTNCQKAGAGCDSGILEREKLCFAGSRSAESAAFGDAVSCMEYDLAEYARQLRYIRLKSEGKIKTGVEYLSKMGRKDHLTPIVTIVLYHGTEPWDAPKKLSEMMELGRD